MTTKADVMASNNDRLLRDLVDIPTSVQKSDFVISLANGIADPERTVGEYVVTRDLAESFDQALALVSSSLDDRKSKGAYLHGSFGSGKSHFMAVLHLLLQGDPHARAIPQLAPVIAKHDDTLRDKKILMVPYHFIGAVSMEAGVLGGYVDFVKGRFPDQPLPAVFLDDKILADAARERKEQGDALFFERLSRSGGGLEGFGDLAGGWDAASFERAITAPHDDEDRRRLTADLIDTFFTSYADLAAGSGKGYVPLDEGLSALTKHAKDVLGYDAVILFLDELILWLATRMADADFVSREGSKVGKLIEPTAPRPIPLVSFIARQRDLKDFIGDGVPGAQKASFSHGVQWWDGRFSTITLADTNLPAIVEQRLLKPKSEAAKQELDDAFAAFTSRADRALDTLMTNEADKAAFRRSYPFSPALIKVLVGVSAFLQRERTALRLLMQLLVDRREQLTIGQLVPLGDLWDVIQSEDSFDLELQRHFKKARSLYAHKLRPLLLDTHDLTADEVDDLDERHAFHADDRLAKTLLLAALVPDVDAVRGMTVGRLADLNHGSIRSPIPGQERANVRSKVRRWAASVGELRVDGDDQDPSVSLQLVGVDVASIIEQASSHDTPGARIRMVRDILGESLGLDTRDALLPSYSHLWRGRKRHTDIAFSNVRDPRDLPDSEYRSTLDRPKVIIDYPFDPDDLPPVNDLARIQELRDKLDDVPTLCWLPRSLTDRAKADLGKLVILNFLLTADRLDHHTSHLPQMQRVEAKEVLSGQREQLKAQLRDVLRQAYGVASADPTWVQDDLDLKDQFPTLDGSLSIRPPTSSGLESAFHELLDQLWASVAPAHPVFPEQLRKAELARTLELVAEAAGKNDRRVEVAQPDRRLLKKVIEPLQLGTIGEAHFVLDRHWRDHFHRMQAANPGPLTVARLKEWIDQPSRMALDDPLASLVISAYALDQDLVLRLDGATLRPTTDRLDPRVELTTVPMPSDEAYGMAVDRAPRIFGLHASPIKTAANVSDLAGQLRTTADELLKEARELPGALRRLCDRFDISTSCVRLRTADAAVTLADGILAADSDRASVQFLAEAQVPSTPEALGASLKQARQVRTAIVNTNLELLEIAFGGEHAAEAEVIRDRLVSATEADQLTTDLAAVLPSAERDVTALMRTVNPPKPPTPPGPKAPIAASRSKTLAGAEARVFLQQLAGQPLRSVEISWELDE